MGGRPKKSKKPSGTKAEQLLERSVFFTDECLAVKVPQALRAAGWRIEICGYHFAPRTPDEVWLPKVGVVGWLVLTKDKAIRRKPWEMEKVINYGVRMFTLPSGNMTADQMAEVFSTNRLKIGRLLHHHPEPFVAVVSRSGVDLVRG